MEGRIHETEKAEIWRKVPKITDDFLKIIREATSELSERKEKGENEKFVENY